MVRYSEVFTVAQTCSCVDEIVHHHEIPLLIPAYYKAYIIRRITSGETNGLTGDKKNRAGSALNLRNHGGGKITWINSFASYRTGPAGELPARNVQNKVRKFTGGMA